MPAACDYKFDPAKRTAKLRPKDFMLTQPEDANLTYQWKPVQVAHERVILTKEEGERRFEFALENVLSIKFNMQCKALQDAKNAEQQLKMYYPVRESGGSNDEGVKFKFAVKDVTALH